MKALLPLLIAALIIGLAVTLFIPKVEDVEEVQTDIAEPSPKAMDTPALPTADSPIEAVEAEIAISESPEERARKPYTTLTNTQGTEIQAKILSVSDGQVKIRRIDGLETTIPLNMLSEADIELCEYIKTQSTTQISEPSPSDKKISKPLEFEVQGGVDWDAIFGT